MGYRDELIRRLQNEGSWQRMTKQVQRRLQNLSDDQARQIMVLEDHWVLGDPSAVKLSGLVAVVRMIQLFKGSLVKLDGDDMGSLAKPGRLLAEFLIELTKRGLAVDQIEAGLSQLNPFVIAALITSYELTS